MAMQTAKKSALRRRRGTKQVEIRGWAPVELNDALRVYAASRRQSLSEVLTEAVSLFLKAKGGDEGNDSQLSLLIRNQVQLMRELRVIKERQAYHIESDGLQSQLILGSVPAPRDYQEAVKRRWPVFVAATISNTGKNGGDFLQQLFSETMVRQEDFALPPAELRGATKDSTGA